MIKRISRAAISDIAYPTRLGQDKQRVTIRKTPLITMLVSAVEVYPKETRGVLFGRKDQHTFTVEHAFPYQTAIRTRTLVKVDEDVEKCVDSLLQGLTLLKPIGGFHSHTNTRIGTKLTSMLIRSE